MIVMVVSRAGAIAYALAAAAAAVLVFLILRAVSGKKEKDKNPTAPQGSVTGLRRTYERRIIKENEAAAGRSRIAAANAAAGISKEKHRAEIPARRRIYYPGKGIMSAVQRRNRRYNAGFAPIQGYIARQNGGGEADTLRYGIYRMRFNGCEVIAVYNLLYYLGGRRDIREIAEAFEKKGLALLGSFGTTPEAMREYLDEVLREERKHEGILAKFKASAVLYPSEDAERYDEILEKAGCGILTFWNGEHSWSIHTVMVHRLEKGGIRVYNQYTNVIYNEYASVEHFLRNQGRPYPPVSLIVIEK